MPLLIRLPRTILVLFVVSGIIFVSGAMVIEKFEGKYEAIHGTQNVVNE